MKLCTKCGVVKPVQAFYSDPRNNDGLRTPCKPCVNAARREAYAADAVNSRVKSREYSARWAKANPVRAAAIRRKHNWAKQGIDPQRAAALLNQHDGSCALCGADSPRSKSGWHVDHDHATRKVRAVLCQRCNVGLGAFNDSAELMRRAADYVARHREAA